MNRGPLQTLAIALASVALFATVGLAPNAARANEGVENDGSDFARTGWYLQGSGVFGISAYRDRRGEVDNSTGANFRLGYRANTFAALEVELEWIDRFTEELGGSEPANFRSYVFGANGKAYMAEGRFQPFGIVGVNVMNVKTRDAALGSDGNADWAFRMGGGLDVYATRHVAVSLEATYVWGVGDVWSRDYTSIGGGLLYRF